MSALPIAVRPAGPPDLDRLGELFLEHGQACEALDPAYRRAIDAGRPWREHLVEGLREDRIRIPATVGDDGQLVSFLTARAVTAPLGSAVPFIGFVENAFVQVPFRRQGRLRAMHADALRWFQVKRVPRVELVADLQDADSIAAWRRLGFVQVQAVLRAAVPPE